MLPELGLIIAALCYGIATTSIWEGAVPKGRKFRRTHKPLQFWLLIALIIAFGTSVAIGGVTGQGEFENLVAGRA
ncbi:MAG: hypothetical protein NVS3B5_00300 [Sphingomicrobium sp.]